MAGIGDQLSNMMWQLYQQQILDQMNRASNEEYLLNQYGGSMISNAMQNRMYQQSQEDMYNRLIPRSEQHKAIIDLVKNLDLAGAKNANAIFGGDYVIPQELVDRARQALGGIQEQTAYGSPVTNVGEMLGVLPMEMISKGQQGVLEKNPTPLQVANAQTARMNAEANMLTGRNTESPDIAANRELIKATKTRLDNLTDDYGRIKVDNNEMMMKILAEWTADEQNAKTKDMLTSWIGQDATLDKWLQKVGPQFLMNMKMAVSLIDPKNLGPNEKLFLAESADVYTMWKRYMLVHEREVARMSMNSGEAKKLQQLTRKVIDPVTGQETLIEGNPEADLEFAKRIWKVLIYGE